jgi:malonyl-CoA O-methyltransferase
MNSLERLRKLFDVKAPRYSQYAIMQLEIGHRLLQRLDYLKMQPECILELGCGAGMHLKSLKARYPKATIAGVDSSFGMLSVAKKQKSWWQKSSLIFADANCLPFPNGSIDLIIANQLLHWLPDHNHFFAECFRVLKPDGGLMFSTLGPDTFKEFRQAFAPLDTASHTMDFIDLHDLGDALLKQGFLDPVMDREDLVLNYSSQDTLLQSLRAQGVRNFHPNRNKGLMSKSKWQKMWVMYPKQQSKWPVSYEIIYGQAWRGSYSPQKGEQVISLAKLRASIPSQERG